MGAIQQISVGDLVEIIDPNSGYYRMQGRVTIAGHGGLYVVKIGDDEFGFIDSQIKKV